MRWLNPAAFYGLLAVAVPIFVHLFGRRIAKRQRFPTLRLLRDVKPTPVTCSTPSDLLLLLLRCASIVAAVLGLAQPRFSQADGDTERVLAIVVDTSTSMSRLTSDSVRARDRARALAQQKLDSAGDGLVIETANPGATLAGATSWLDRRAGLRELVVVSDFQRGAVEDGDFAGVPDDIGVQTLRVPVRADAVSHEDTTWFGSVPMSVDSTSTGADWILPPDTTLPVAVFAADSDAARVRASIAAVLRAVPIRSMSTRKVAAVFAGYPRTNQLPTASFHEPWQGDVLERLTRDPLILSAARDSAAAPTCPSTGVPVRNLSREAIAGVAAGPQGSQHELLVFVCAGPGTLTGTAVLAATVRAFAAFPSLGEFETRIVPDEVLQKWNRRPTERVGPGENETSPDGRWFWLLTVALLALEEWIRRKAPRRASTTETEERHARVA